MSAAVSPNSKKRTRWPYIVRDDNGRVVVERCGIRVSTLVIDHLYQGVSAFEMVEAYPGLTVSQVYSALAYYFEHKIEMDEAIAQEERDWDVYRSVNPNRFTRDELLERARAHNVSLGPAQK